jgi:hypothetical protein
VDLALGSVNWLGVALAVLASSVLGGAWFTALFGRLYAVSLGRAEAPPGKPAPLFIWGPMVCTLVTTITTALLMGAARVTTLTGAVTFGLLVGLGYIVATLINIAINPNFPRPFLYSAVCGPYFLISTVGSTLILYGMG